MTFEKLMGDFAFVVGAEAPVPDSETGACAFDFDGNMVTFEADRQAEAVVMTADVGGVPDEGADLLARILLEANFMRRGTDGSAILGIDADWGTLCLGRRDPLASLDGKAYAAIVETFLDVLEMWQHRLNAYPELAGSIADAKAEEAEEVRRALIGDGFIRV